MATTNTTSTSGSKQASSEALLEKRAKLLAGALSQFLADWHQATAGPSSSASPSARQAKGKQKVAGKAAAAKTAPPSSKGKKAVPKDPKDECLAKVMQELDERINKSKKCKLDDMYSALLQLDDQEQHVLSSILSGYASKLLGEKANDASMAIRDCLCAAAAACHYQRPQEPEASRSSAAAYRQQGLPARSGLDAGFTAGQLLRAGYSAAEVVQTGVALDKLRAAGISVGDLFSSLPPAEQAELSGTAGAAKLKAAGYTAAAVQKGAAPGAFSTWDLKLAGFPVSTVPISSTAAPVGAVAGGGGLSPRSRLQGGALQLRQQQVMQEQQSQLQQQGRAGPQQAGVLVGPRDVQYFRHQIVPLMHMKAEQDVARLLLSSQRAAARIVPAAAAAAGSGLRSTTSYGHSLSRRAARTSSSTSRAPQRLKWQLGEEHSSKQQQQQQLQATPEDTPAAQAAPALVDEPAG